MRSHRHQCTASTRLWTARVVLGAGSDRAGPAISSFAARPRQVTKNVADALGSIRKQSRSFVILAQARIQDATRPFRLACVPLAHGPSGKGAWRSGFPRSRECDIDPQVSCFLTSPKGPRTHRKTTRNKAPRPSFGRGSRIAATCQRTVRKLMGQGAMSFPRPRDSRRPRRRSDRAAYAPNAGRRMRARGLLGPKPSPGTKDKRGYSR
jgi:hypothetical protein